jgi:flagellar motor switch protein FliN
MNQSELAHEAVKEDELGGDLGLPGDLGQPMGLGEIGELPSLGDGGGLAPGLGEGAGPGSLSPNGVEEDELSAAIDELRDALQEGSSSSLEDNAAELAGENHGVIMDIPVDVQIVLGSTEMPVSELMALQKGSTVALDRRIGEPVDVVVNGRKIATGEVTVLDSDPSRFGIRLTHIIDSTRQG